MGEFLAKKFGAAQALLLGIAPTDWLIAGIVGAVVWAALWALRNLIASRYKKHSLQQAVNFRIIDELRQLGVEFAYPTQLVFFDRHRAALD